MTRFELGWMAWLRHELVRDLTAAGVVPNSGVVEALSTVPRHVFLPDVTLTAVYTDSAVDRIGAAYAHWAGMDVRPLLTAIMLGELAPALGEHVIHIGTGTGYTAALVAHLVGPTGHVTTVEIDPDRADAARGALSSTWYSNITVVCADATIYHPVGRFGSVLLSAAVRDLYPGWWQLLAGRGRIVAPLHVKDTQLLLTLDTAADCWVGHAQRLPEPMASLRTPNVAAAAPTGGQPTVNPSRNPVSAMPIPRDAVSSHTEPDDGDVLARVPEWERWSRQVRVHAHHAGTRPPLTGPGTFTTGPWSLLLNAPPAPLSDCAIGHGDGRIPGASPPDVTGTAGPPHSRIRTVR